MRVVGATMRGRWPRAPHLLFGTLERLPERASLPLHNLNSNVIDMTLLFSVVNENGVTDMYCPIYLLQRVSTVAFEGIEPRPVAVEVTGGCAGDVVIQNRAKSYVRGMFLYAALASG